MLSLYVDAVYVSVHKTELISW